MLKDVSQKLNTAINYDLHNMQSNNKMRNTKFQTEMQRVTYLIQKQPIPTNFRGFDKIWDPHIAAILLAIIDVTFFSPVNYINFLYKMLYWIHNICQKVSRKCHTSNG